MKLTGEHPSKWLAAINPHVNLSTSKWTACVDGVYLKLVFLTIRMSTLRIPMSSNAPRACILSGSEGWLLKNGSAVFTQRLGTS